MKTHEPFILRTRVAIPLEPSPSSEHIYDHDRQIWVNVATGIPVVSENHTKQQASTFGETSITETREGADQSEASSINASQFGETMMTRSFEGHDQGESVLASKFGETSVTATREGHDTREIISGTTDASNRHF